MFSFYAPLVLCHPSGIGVGPDYYYDLSVGFSEPPDSERFYLLRWASIISAVFVAETGLEPVTSW